MTYASKLFPRRARGTPVRKDTYRNTNQLKQRPRAHTTIVVYKTPCRFTEVPTLAMRSLSIPRNTTTRAVAVTTWHSPSADGAFLDVTQSITDRTVVIRVGTYTIYSKKHSMYCWIIALRVCREIDAVDANVCCISRRKVRIVSS